MAQQRYSYLGLFIVIVMGLIAAWLIEEFFEEQKPISTRRVSYEAIENALRMQCNERHGQLAIGNGPQGTYITCHQGQKQLWMVRL